MKNHKIFATSNIKLLVVFYGCGLPREARAATAATTQAALSSYRDPKEITDEMLHELIDRIIIYEKVKDGDKASQRIDIIFNFVGSIDLSPTPEELEEQRQVKLAKEKSRINRRRKYEEKYREKKRTEKLAEKEGHKFPKKICQQCGREYWPNSTRQLYCDKQCAYDYRQNLLHERRWEEKAGKVTEGSRWDLQTVLTKI